VLGTAATKALSDSSQADRAVVFPPGADSSAHYKGLRVSVLGYILSKNKTKPFYGAEFSPIPFINYAPETSLGFGFLGAFLLPRPAAHATWRRSVVEAALYFTLRNQLEAKIRPDIWLANNRLHLGGFFRVRNFPFFFYGLGNRTLSANREPYRSFGFKARATAEWAPVKHLYLSVGLEFENEDLKERQEGGLLIGDSIPGSASYLIFGPTLGLVYDNRDNIFYPRKGGYYGFQAAWFAHWLGSTTPHVRLEADLRQFVSLAPRHTLAFQLRSAYSTDGTPFQLLPTVGGDNLLRGYFGGRYRDQFMLAFQLEHRWNFYKKYGLVVFGGVGDVLPGPDAWDRWSTKWGVGIGFRMRVSDDGINVRADFGYGSAFSPYLDFGEAY